MKKTIKIAYVAALTLIISALAFFALQGYKNQIQEGEIFGKNTFTQSMIQADGTEVNFYASGDQYFNYLHDNNGYILLRDNGYLVYAKSDNGRPIPTQVRYTDTKEKIDALNKMTYSEINFAQNSDLITTYQESEPSTLYQSAASSVRPIVNIVIYICFAGETVNLNNQMIDSYLNGANNSLADYYNRISYGKIMIHNINPINNGEIFIYQDSMPRSYYQLKQGDSGRAIKERTLLNNAVNASKQYLNLENLDIDSDNDGYVDAVNFLISGSPYSEWGGMLWPHSWDLNDISFGNPATIDGYKVKKYSFNFLEQLTVGLLAHEFAHVLGVPDLYHYDDPHVAVGNWDLMHYEADIPQFMTTHLRYKYLNVLNERQIAQIEYNGIYSLKPVAKADKDDVLAYRINTQRPDEYFMMEYRNNNVSGYDASLPGSGLIVYRVKVGVYGNADAKKENVNYPDELYIFRPNVVTVGTEKTKSLANLNKAYLSPSNPDFMSLGFSLAQKPSTRYDKTTIYYTDGYNSGIVINAVSINDNEITFEVRLSGENSVDDNYFKDKLRLDNAKLNNDGEFSGVYADLNITNFNLIYMSNIIAVLRSESNKEVASIRLDRNKFITSYSTGLRSFPVRFIINNKGNTGLMSVFYHNEWYSYDEPVKIELYAVDSDNDYVFINDYPINNSIVSWNSVELTNVVYKPSVAASLRSTVAIRSDGRAYVSSRDNSLNGLVVEDVISADAGPHHLLFITSDLKVTCYTASSTSTKEDMVGGWNNIIKVAAGQYVSYGLDLSGNVSYAGDLAEKGVSSWSNIIDISAGLNHIVGLRRDGTVVAAGTGAKCAVGSWTNIVGIAAGETFTAGLRRNGTVVIAGELSGYETVSAWTDIVKIVAGERHLLALDKFGRAHATGQNHEGQCNVNGLYDIIDIGAGYTHSVLLREDGILIYRGSNQTTNITENLKYFNNNYIDVSSIVAPFDTKIIKKGQTYQFNLAFFPHNATYQKITYTSSASLIVSITSDGFMKAESVGTAEITATHRGSSLNVKMHITVIEPIETEVMIVAGDSHSVILDNQGTVSASGSNSFGQLDVEMWGNVIFIAAGGNTTAAITNNNKVLVAGELSGMGAENWNNIVLIATSGRTLVGIDTNGAVLTIGDNDFGQLNNITGANIKDVKATATHTVTLSTNGEVRAYGNNGRYQLNVNNWNRVVQIAAGEGFTVGLRDDGKVLYTGFSTFMPDMTTLSSWNDIVYISAGSNHIAGVDFNGNVKAIGNNSFGQINTAWLRDIGIIAAGGEHTIGITYEGLIAGVGRNNDNRLTLPPVEPMPFISLDNAYFEEINYGADPTFGVRVNERRKLNLIFEPFNASDRKSSNIIFQSDNLGNAVVDADGYVTGIKSGPANVSVTIKRTNLGDITTSIAVFVYDNASSVRLVDAPTRTVYSYGEQLDLLGGRIEVDLGQNRKFIKNITADMINNYDNATKQIGTTAITISEGTHTLEYQIKVLNTTKSIEISNATNLKTVYDFGDEIDLNGGWVVRTLANGTVLQPQSLVSLLSGAVPLEIIADTNILATTTVTLKYTDPVASEEGISNILYFSFQIQVFDKVTGITVDLDKNTFNYGEEIFGNGRLIINMKSGIDIIEPIIQKDEIIDGVDSVITISNFNKYLLGIHNVKFNYYNPDFLLTPDMYPQMIVNVSDNITNVEITSMKLNEAAVYDKNKSLDECISARVYFHGGAIIEVGRDNGNQLFDNVILSFGNPTTHADGFTYVAMDVKVSDTTGSGVTKYSRQQKVFGLSGIKTIELVGNNSFLYGEDTQIHLRITADDDEVYEIDIDDTALGIDNTRLTPQTISFSLMGKTAYKTIQFHDYVTAIYTDVISLTVIVNQSYQDFPIKVYRIMASGAELLATDWVTYNYDKTTPGTQMVTIVCQGFQYSITVNVLNAISSITVLTSPKTTYEVHDEIDLSNFSIRLNFLHGSPETVYYNQNDFIVSGYDKHTVGIQFVTITYQVTGDVFEYQFEVRNKIRRIKVDLINSKIVYIVGENLQIRLICVYENGDEVPITDSFNHNYQKDMIGTQHVNITYWGQYSTAIIVETIDAPEKITITAPTKKYYEYGETLNLDGGRITITTKTGKLINESLKVYSNYLSSFNPTPASKGGQTITLNIPQYNVSADFVVYVREKSTSNILSVKEGVEGIRIDRTNTRIILEESATLASFNNMVDSYLTVHYKNQDGNYLNLANNQNMLLNGNITVEIKNSEGTLIEGFRVYVKGDANRDGKFDKDDLPGLAQALLQNFESTAIYADYNNDRVYTLTDFILWVQKAEQQEGDQ